ncbi:MAG: hypothetical protein U0325_11715 [Polyangiales bacterium]
MASQLPSPSLQRLLRAPEVSLAEVAAHLDRLTPEDRREQLAALKRGDQRRLWGLAEGAPPITRDFFVPSGVGPRKAVHHDGKNTLPIPGFTRFQKVFARPDDNSPRLFGYNRGRSEGIVGPGYFVTVDTAGNDAWVARGPVVVDYFQVPDGPVPEAWPRVRPNSQGLQYFVYHRTRDFMRRVSQHVSIGAAYKVERPLDHYFTLCRQDP